jgi:hypothetical protein
MSRRPLFSQSFILSRHVCCDVLTVIRVTMFVFRIVAPCWLVWDYRRFRGLYYLHHQGDEWAKGGKLMEIKWSKADKAEHGQILGNVRIRLGPVSQWARGVVGRSDETVAWEKVDRDGPLLGQRETAGGVADMWEVEWTWQQDMKFRADRPFHRGQDEATPTLRPS